MKLLRSVRMSLQTQIGYKKRASVYTWEGKGKSWSGTDFNPFCSKRGPYASMDHGRNRTDKTGMGQVSFRFKNRLFHFLSEPLHFLHM